MEKEKDIKDLFTHWLRSKQLESLLFTLSVSLPITIFFSLILGWYSLLILLFVSLFSLSRNRQQQNNFQSFTNELDNRFPSLEHSSSLLSSSDEELSSLSLLQKQKVEEALNQISIAFPISRKSVYTLFAALLISTIMLLLWPLTKPFFHSSEAIKRSTNTNHSSLSANDTIQVIPEIQTLQINIQPPAYTALPSFKSSAQEISIPYYSNVQWKVRFEGSVAAAKLVFGQGKELPLNKSNDNAWITSQTLKESQFFSLHFQDQYNIWHKSDYYQLNIIKDLAVEIEVNNLPQFAEYVFTKEKTITFNTLLKDDYGISNSYILATLSKGEGESVTFKDDTLSFQQNFNRQKKEYNLQKSIKLTELGMEPGDELYLHIEAIDNRTPDPQLSKTYKYIIAFEDTTKVSKEMYGRMAINRMPDYFRSQRQIIIDTERLISRKGEMTANPFQNASNNIAADQKLLRLRYGQFLGEEFETVIGENGAADFPDHVHDETCAHDSTTVKVMGASLYLANHKQDGEANNKDVAQKSNKKEAPKAKKNAHEGHNHGSSQNDRATNSPIAVEEALLPYYHVHDIAEEATFFDAATTAKLRAALANMWDAELHLRMGEPQKALPYEYQALKLIKEVQQASRVYVERVGFEPPEIKVAEKRLSGELDEIQTPLNKKKKLIKAKYPHIQASISILEQMKVDFRYPRPEEKLQLQQAGEELASIVLNQENNFLLELQQLRSIMEKEIKVDQFLEYVQNIQRAFSRMVPTYEKPQKDKRGKHQLKELYLKAITD